MSVEPHVHRGFTLLELLVVIVIIGIIAAMLTLSVGTATPDSSAVKEMERIANLVRLASEEAVLGGREYGITFYDKEYEFSILDPARRRWQPFTGEGPFNARKYPADAIAELYIEGRSVRLALEKPPPPADELKEAAAQQKDRSEIAGDQDGKAQDEDPEDTKEDQTEDPRRPQILILSSGEIMPGFELRLRPRSGGKGTWLRVFENVRTERFADEV
jgi:general secretion pathway protein H